MAKIKRKQSKKYFGVKIFSVINKISSLIYYTSVPRSWWQVMGCVGVPLYKIYPRKTQWRTVRPEEAPETEVTKLSRADSVDDMIAQVLSKK